MATKIQKCIILAGGEGTRMKSILGNMPKSLAIVGDKPFLSYIFEWLETVGIEEIIVATGIGGDKIRDFCLGYNSGVSVKCIREPFPLGTGGAIKYVMEKESIEECMVTNGDSFVNCGVKNLLSPLKPESNISIRIGGVKVVDSGRFGAIKLADNGVVKNFGEKAHRGLGIINSGIYYLSYNAFDKSLGRSFSFERDVLEIQANRGVVECVVLEGKLIDIGVPDDYLTVCEQIKGKTA